MLRKTDGKQLALFHIFTFLLNLSIQMSCAIHHTEQMINATSEIRFAVCNHRYCPTPRSRQIPVHRSDSGCITCSCYMFTVGTLHLNSFIIIIFQYIFFLPLEHFCASKTPVSKISGTCSLPFTASPGQIRKNERLLGPLTRLRWGVGLRHNSLMLLSSTEHIMQLDL